MDAVIHTNNILGDLPFSLYLSIDYKTTSSIVGAVFCESLSVFTDGVVNPIEKGHPDLIPEQGAGATEGQLRNYPQGLEIKTTVGNITQGANLRAGETRIQELVGITWQAHHRETKELMGLIWDFVEGDRDHNYPIITGAFYSDNLDTEDWGKISGTTGRNTKVTGMRVSGKQKMGNGCVALLNRAAYCDKYSKLLNFDLNF